MNPNAEVRTYSKPSGHRKVAGIPVSLIALALALSGVVAAVIVSHYQSAPSSPAGASISWASAPATSPNINTLVTGQLQAQGINGFTVGPRGAAVVWKVADAPLSIWARSNAKG